MQYLSWRPSWACEHARSDTGKQANWVFSDGDTWNGLRNQDGVVDGRATDNVWFAVVVGRGRVSSLKQRRSET